MIEVGDIVNIKENDSVKKTNYRVIEKQEDGVVLEFAKHKETGNTLNIKLPFKMVKVVES